MAYVTPSTALTGDLIDAADWNKNTVDNPIALRTGAIAIASQAIGDLVVATSATQLGRVADVATGQVLVSGGVATAPAYSASPSLTSLTLSTALSVSSGGTGVATQQAYGVLVGGTTATGVMQSITPGTSTKVLTSAGTGALPAWSQPSNLTQSFRGLTLRTSPDADLAAANVLLDHADEIVMQDGVSVSDWNDLTANIAVSGAGGLDTGTEGASRWYSIHAIRKSSDGTKNLLLHRAKSYDLNQSQSTLAYPINVPLRSSVNDERRATPFTPSVTGSVPFIDIGLWKVLAPTGQFWITIEATSGGVPSGTPLATSDKIDVSLLTTTSPGMNIRMPFRTPASLTASTQYWIVFYGNFTISATNYVKISNNNTASTTASYNGATWTTGAGTAIYFKHYVTQNDTALTMPSGYDQYAQVGWVYNDSGSNFDPFEAHDRNVANGQDFASVVTGGGATIQTLVDGSAFWPPVPVFAEKMMIRNNSLASVHVDTRLSSGGYNAILHEANNATGAANYNYETPADFLIEFQHLYYKVSAGAGWLYPKSYRW